MDRRLQRLVRSKFRAAGRRYEEARRDYADARDTARGGERVNIVCRRYAEKRSVELDSAGRPECYDADHPDCEGCVEDLQAGTIETW
ncbi:MAG: hypothetical protein QXG03_03790 [Halalkalicoccus sp.]